MIGCRPLTDVELEQIKQSFKSTRDRALFVLGTKTGLRITELLSLTIGDVSSATGTILDRLTVHRRNVKGRTNGRSIVLHHEARIALLTWLAEYPCYPTAPLFPSLKYPRRTPLKPISRMSPDGSTLSQYKAISRVTAWRIIKHAVEHLGLEGKIATHSMRKTFANNVYHRLNKDLLKTKQALGHKDINSTISYLSFDQGEVDNAILS